jgi:Methyltransferase domain
MVNRPTPQTRAPIQLLQDPDWQMSFGERAALEGVLAQLQPKLAIEIGTAEGGSLRRIAVHSEVTHSFDLVLPHEEVRNLPGVTLHTGDNHELLPRLLSELAEAGENVDFVLVDGDHSTEGVRRDVEDLLESQAIAHSVILMHDTMNEVVRAGLEEVRYGAYPKVAHVDLDFVAGYMFQEPSLKHELWGGLGLVVVDSSRSAYFTGNVRQSRYYPAYDLIRAARDQLLDLGEAQPSEVRELRQELAETRGWLEAVQSSASWKLTSPLRALKTRLARALKR